MCSPKTILACLIFIVVAAQASGTETSTQTADGKFTGSGDDVLSMLGVNISNGGVIGNVIESCIYPFYKRVRMISLLFVVSIVGGYWAQSVKIGWDACTLKS